MSEPFRPYEKLVDITIFGKKFQVPEPEGGAHTDHEAAAQLLDTVLDRQLVALTNQPVRDLVDARYEKFRKMGQFFDLGN